MPQYMVVKSLERLVRLRFRLEIEKGPGEVSVTTDPIRIGYEVTRPLYEQVLTPTRQKQRQL